MGLKAWSVHYVGVPTCSQQAFAYAKEQHDMCALSGTADTNGQTFFQVYSREKLHLYLNEPANLAFFIDRWSFWFFVTLTGTVTTAQFFKGCHKMIEDSRSSTFSTVDPRNTWFSASLLAPTSFSLVATWERTYRRLKFKSNLNFVALFSGVASTVPGGWMLR